MALCGLMAAYTNVSHPVAAVLRKDPVFVGEGAKGAIVLAVRGGHTDLTVFHLHKCAVSLFKGMTAFSTPCAHFLPQTYSGAH